MCLTLGERSNNGDKEGSTLRLSADLGRRNPPRRDALPQKRPTNARPLEHITRAPRRAPGVHARRGEQLLVSILGKRPLEGERAKGYGRAGARNRMLSGSPPCRTCHLHAPVAAGAGEEAVGAVGEAQAPLQRVQLEFWARKAALLQAVRKPALRIQLLLGELLRHGRGD